MRAPGKSAVADSCIVKQASKQRDTCSFSARVEKQLERLCGGDRRLTREIPADVGCWLSVHKLPVIE
jgi:hypothetical protein